MKPLLFIVLPGIASLVILGGCGAGEAAPAPSWTEARLHAAPPGAAPAFIERAVLTAAERRMLDAGLDETLAARDAVRTAAARLTTPTLDTAEFVVEARARGLPPAQ